MPNSRRWRRRGWAVHEDLQQEARGLQGRRPPSVKRTHAIQAITDADPRATVLSVDGISAYDTISRVAMLRGLRRMEGSDALLPFVSQIYGSPSTYLWEDEE